MVYTKKAISPVVATALLLVVAVVAVVGFQSWFTTYQSGVNSKVEQDSASGSVIYVDRLETINGTVYVRNTATDNVTLKSNSKIVNADGAPVADCDGDGDFISANATSEGVSEHALGTCSLNPGSKYDVVLVTSDGIYTSTQLAR